MRRSADFARTVRDGARSGRQTLVVHLVHDDQDAGARVGFVVPRSVGGAVVRNKVKRRLRAIVADRLPAFGGDDVVVRALPGAAEVSMRRLADDLDSAVRTARRRALEKSSHE
ncbi:MAG: ribonuclease P protein component [Micrococcales bacterium]|nr:ribonuclease P protein component [Micrococcales bacterium]